MSLREAFERDVAERVAVDDEETIGSEQWQGPGRTSARAQHMGFPGIAHLEARLCAVADQPRDGLGAMVQVDDDPVDAGLA